MNITVLVCFLCSSGGHKHRYILQMVAYFYTTRVMPRKTRPVAMWNVLEWRKQHLWVFRPNRIRALELSGSGVRMPKILEKAEFITHFLFPGISPSRHNPYLPAPLSSPPHPQGHFLMSPFLLTHLSHLQPNPFQRVPFLPFPSPSSWFGTLGVGWCRRCSVPHSSGVGEGFGG